MITTAPERCYTAPKFPYGFVIKSKEEIKRATGCINGSTKCWDAYVGTLDPFCGRVTLEDHTCEEKPVKDRGVWGLRIFGWSWDHRWLTPIIRVKASEYFENKMTNKIVGAYVPGDIQTRMKYKRPTEEKFDFSWMEKDDFVTYEKAQYLKGVRGLTDRDELVEYDEVCGHYLYFLGEFWYLSDLDLLVEDVVAPKTVVLGGEEYLKKKGEVKGISYVLTLSGKDYLSEALPNEDPNAVYTDMSIFDKTTRVAHKDNIPLVEFKGFACRASWFNVLCEVAE